ncbi:MAG: YaeQ family protein [Deltaproteobacteria bacterium]
MSNAPTLHELELTLHHVDRGIERELKLRTARHPSETVERLWLRLLAYAWQWEEGIAFGPGLSDPEAPDVEARDLTGRPTLWLRVGKAEPAKIQRALDRGQGARVAVLFDSPARLEAFCAVAAEEGVDRLAAVDPGLLAGLRTHDERRVRLTLTLVGDHFYLDVGGEALDGPLTLGRA